MLELFYVQVPERPLDAKDISFVVVVSLAFLVAVLWLRARFRKR